jgi:hypothetical protein
MTAAHEQRLTQRLFRYWELIRKYNKMPQIEHFNSAAVEDLWPQCMLIAADTRRGVVFKFDYMGDYIVRTYGKDLTAQIVEMNNVAFPGGGMYKKLLAMIEQPVPLEDGGYFLNESGEMIKYRACFLPFGTDDKGATHILIGLSFRAF